MSSASPAELELDRRRALVDEFLKDCPDTGDSLEKYRGLLTEQSNPATAALSQTAKTDMASAIGQILAVEQSAIKGFMDAKYMLALNQMRIQIREARAASKKVFLVGCGASGRMALLIERLLREQSPEEASHFIAVLAGGDVALANALARFEDDPARAVKQLSKQGYIDGDLVIGFSASGSAKFVQSAVNHAAKSDPKNGLFVCCNNAEAVRSRAAELGFTALQSDDVPVYGIESEAPAISGSTRMHPTTLMTLTCQTVLDIAANSHENFADHVALLQKAIAELPMDELANMADFEAETYKDGGRLQYKILAPGASKVTIYTDLTERNPTFNLPRLGCLDEQASKIEAGQEAWAWPSFVDCSTPEAVWADLLGNRKAVTLHDPIFPETTPEYLERCDYSAKSGSDWKAALKSVAKTRPTQDLEIVDTETSFRFTHAEGSFSVNTEGLSPLFRQLLLKVVLNAHSSAVMAKCGLCYGNVMTNLSPSNIKLVARAEIQCQNYFAAQTAESLKLSGTQKARIDHALIRQHLIQTVLSLPAGKSIYDETIARCMETVHSIGVSATTFATAGRDAGSEEPGSPIGAAC